MSGWSNDCLRVCNVKMKKNYLGRNRAYSREFTAYRAVASCNLNYLLDERICLDPKMSDFE